MGSGWGWCFWRAQRVEDEIGALGKRTLSAGVQVIVPIVPRGTLLFREKEITLFGRPRSPNLSRTSLVAVPWPGVIYRSRLVSRSQITRGRYGVRDKIEDTCVGTRCVLRVDPSVSPSSSTFSLTCPDPLQSTIGSTVLCFVFPFPRVCAHAQTCAHTDTRTQTCAHTHTRKQGHTRTHGQTCAHTHTRTHVRTHTDTNMYTHEHTDTNMCNP